MINYTPSCIIMIVLIYFERRSYFMTIEPIIIFIPSLPTPYGELPWG
ncbi:hypothetical protein CMALT430_170193 [Carnobacterium maltaromaticum]|nr:hypothetical protein CMALT430_170193 [Carnobacterium maltaromaticum]